MTSIRPRPFVHSVTAALLTFLLLVVAARASAATPKTFALSNPDAFETPGTDQAPVYGDWKPPRPGSPTSVRRRP